MSDSCELVDCSPPGSSVHGILQARILEWVALLTSRGSSQPRDWTCVSPIKLALASGFFTTSTAWEPLLSYAHILLVLFFWRTLTNTPSVHTHTLVLFLSLCSRPAEAHTSMQLCCSSFHLFIQCLYQTETPPGLDRSACSPCLLNRSACCSLPCVVRSAGNTAVVADLGWMSGWLGLSDRLWASGTPICKSKL